MGAIAVFRSHAGAPSFVVDGIFAVDDSGQFNGDFDLRANYRDVWFVFSIWRID
ncbi:hypothetical protein D3C76_1582230 [compost metagenome]